MICAPKLPPFSGRVFNSYGNDYAEITVQRRTDYGDIKRARERLADKGCLWKAKYGGLNVSDARKLKAHETVPAAKPYVNELGTFMSVVI